MKNFSNKSLYGSIIVFVVSVGLATWALFVPQVRGQTPDPAPGSGQATAVLVEETLSATDTTPTLIEETPAVIDATPTSNEDTPTPADWWYRELPLEKRAVYETDTARRTEIANIPTVARPTKIYPTTGPIQLEGTPAGAGVIQEGEMAPLARGNLALGSTAWSAVVNDEIIQVFVGDYVENPEQGIVVIYWWSRDGTHQTRPMQLIQAPSQEGSLVIKDAEGTTLLLGSAQGSDLRLNVLTAQFETQ